MQDARPTVVRFPLRRTSDGSFEPAFVPMPTNTPKGPVAPVSPPRSTEFTNLSNRIAELVEATAVAYERAAMNDPTTDADHLLDVARDLIATAHAMETLPARGWIGHDGVTKAMLSLDRSRVSSKSVATLLDKVEERQRLVGPPALLMDESVYETYAAASYSLDKHELTVDFARARPSRDEIEALATLAAVNHRAAAVARSVAGRTNAEITVQLVSVVQRLSRNVAQPGITALGTGALERGCEFHTVDSENAGVVGEAMWRALQGTGGMATALRRENGSEKAGAAVYRYCALAGLPIDLSLPAELRLFPTAAAERFLGAVSLTPPTTAAGPGLPV